MQDIHPHEVGDIDAKVDEDVHTGHTYGLNT